MHNLGKSVQQVASSSKTLSEVSAEQHRKNILAAERTQLLLDCYRTGQANNPEVFVTAVAATLARYPDQVIYDVTDPRTGIPSKISWMPTIKDIREACERAYEPIKEEIERDKRIAEQMKLREEYESKPRPTYDELKAKYGQNWGIAPERATRTADEKKAENAAALQQARGRVEAEYAAAGMVPPSKLALSPTALRSIADRDAMQELSDQLEAGIGPSTFANYRTNPEKTVREQGETE